jgi:hypothetical protein
MSRAFWWCIWSVGVVLVRSQYSFDGLLCAAQLTKTKSALMMARKEVLKLQASSDVPAVETSEADEKPKPTPAANKPKPAAPKRVRAVVPHVLIWCLGETAGSPNCWCLYGPLIRQLQSLKNQRFRPNVLPSRNW